MSAQESGTVNIPMKDVPAPPAHRELHDPTAPSLVDEKGEQTYLDHEGRFIERSPADHRKLMWRIDLHVIPWIAILYFLAFLDRVNIGNARLFGLEADTGLHGTQYNIALLLFFIPYILFEVPSNLLLKKMRPRLWLPSLMLGWGLVTMFMGWTHNLGGLIACRWFLGVFEAGLLPGCVYVIAMWYKRHEGISLSGSLTFGAKTNDLLLFFGNDGGCLCWVYSWYTALTDSLLAYLINLMDGTSGYRSWRWIFILEGLLTVVVSIVAFFFLIGFPDDSKFLSEEDKHYVVARLNHDLGAATSEKITFKRVMKVMLDWKVWCFMYLGTLTGSYSIAVFTPTILKDFGYTAVKAQLYSIPPYVAAVAYSIIVAVAADKLKHRCGFLVFSISLSITGFAMAGWAMASTNARYAGIFLAAMGNYTAMPLMLTWMANNMGGSVNRGVGSALQISFGNIGGIVSSLAFQAKDAPRYTNGYIICISFLGMTWLLTFVYYFALKHENAARDGGKRDHLRALAQHEELGDKHPDFRYTL